MTERHAAENDLAYCNGLCVMAHEILEGYSGVAYPHPDCEKHGDANILPPGSTERGDA